MKRFILAALVWVMVSGPAWGAEYNNKQFCTLMKNLASDVNKDGPSWVDSYTRSDGMAVLCATKMVDIKKFIKVRPSDFRLGWQERKQRQWNAIYCKQPTLNAVRNGWLIQTTLTFIDGYQFRIHAKCPPSD
jgi:hypothetical protein